VSNLLSNAFRHAAGSAVDVTVSREGELARVEVRDHGAGVPENDLEGLFERYRRGNAKRERGGLGLGLYIARHLVEAHGGTLEARSKPGDGCSFTVALPMPEDYASRDGSQ
jgi:two-component system phosphate regulon sensor histidine kinase PhoR